MVLFTKVLDGVTKTTTLYKHYGGTVITTKLNLYQREYITYSATEKDIRVYRFTDYENPWSSKYAIKIINSRYKNGKPNKSELMIIKDDLEMDELIKTLVKARVGNKVQEQTLDRFSDLDHII